MFSNNAIDQDFYSQNCGVQSPTAYHVTVPAGKYVSFSQAQANLLAQNYAQEQANQHGTCFTPDVTLNELNDFGVNVTVLLHNTGTGQNYTFTAGPHTEDVLGDVPPGNYDITLTPQSSTGYYNYSVGCGYYGDGPGAMTFYGIDISSSCNSIDITN